MALDLSDVYFCNETATNENYTYCHTLARRDALPIFVTIFASGCVLIQASTFAETVLVASIPVPSGIWTSTSTSGRSDTGKNCCWTTPRPRSEEHTLNSSH